MSEACKKLAEYQIRLLRDAKQSWLVGHHEAVTDDLAMLTEAAIREALRDELPGICPGKYKQNGGG